MSLTRRLTEIGWPAERLGEALALLGRHSGLGGREVEMAAPSLRPAAPGASQVGPWIEAAASWLGLEAEPVETPYAEAQQLVAGAGPALLYLPDTCGPRYLAIGAGRRRRVPVLTPDGAVAHVAVEAVRAALCREVEAPIAAEVERVLADAGICGRRRHRARQTLLRQLLAETRIGGCWLLRSAGPSDLATQAREARLPRLLGIFLGAHTCEYLLWILSWWLLGWMSLRGHLELGWLLAWQLLLVLLIPFRLLTTIAGGQLSIRAGAVLKRRLLFGALQLDPDEVRHQGAGQLLGRVIESSEVELLATSGGLLSVTAVTELALAGLVLGAGAGSWLHVVLLAATVLATILLGLSYYRRRRHWTTERLSMTDDLVERMIGHRTRLAQKGPEPWNEGEDQALERYLGASRQLDGTAIALQVLVPRGWFLVAFLGLVPAFIVGGRSTAVLAVCIGGIILAYRALSNLVQGLDRLAGAAIAWERVIPFWQAAARTEPLGNPQFAVTRSPAKVTKDSSASVSSSPSGNGRPILEAHDLVFRYRDRADPVLQGVVLRICPGDRLLLEGSSGGGKSTLAAVLAGCRVPQSGLLLLDGLDRETFGAEAWRRRVVLAPQFHENHIIMGTFAFNVLFGRSWPPRQADLEEAESVCRALGLGPLLDLMPAGLQQTVGETGWQLSHGEKSRLYIARALLQQPDVIILDESFAALDPQTLERTLSFVLQRAPTVLVIAHP
jgi:ATP-binding cassette subfamily B protein